MWSMHASSWIRIQDWTFIILVFEKRTQLYKQKKNIGVPGIDGIYIYSYPPTQAAEFKILHFKSQNFNITGQRAAQHIFKKP